MKRTLIALLAAGLLSYGLYGLKECGGNEEELPAKNVITLPVLQEPHKFPPKTKG